LFGTATLTGITYTITSGADSGPLRGLSASVL